MAMSINIGVIGVGKHGSRYVRHIVDDLPDYSLAAISRRSEEGRDQARQWHTRWYPDWRDLVRDGKVEAVISVTPPALNEEIARCCVAEGKPLLLEKPLAVNRRAAAAIVAMFERAGLPLTVGQTLRYNSVIIALRRLLDTIGPLVAFTASQRLEPSALAWQSDPHLAGGGVVLQTAVHLFDSLRFISGREITRVRATSYRLRNPRLEDLFTAQVEMEGGVVGLVDAAKCGTARSGPYTFVGLEGELHGDQVHGLLEEVRGNRREKVHCAPPTGTIVPLLTDWHAFLRGDRDNPVAGTEGLAAVAVCEACTESASRDCWVEVRAEQ